MRKEHFNQSIAAILALAFGFRLLGISSRPIWYDEAFAILFSQKGLVAMLYGTLAPTGSGSADIHPLGYYTLLNFWMKVFGHSIISARLLSILIGLLTVYLVYLIALEVTQDLKTSLASALIVSLSPFHVHYSQEIRMYSLLAMLLMLATYAYLRGVRDNHWKWWILLSFAAAFAQYTHHLAAFFLVVLALSPLIRKDWKTLYNVTLSGIGALVIYAPWAIQLPAQFSKVQNAYWVERPDLSKLLTLVLVYIFNTPLPASLVAPALFISLTIVTIGTFKTIEFAKTSASSSRQGLWLLYLSIVPPLLLLLFSQWTPVYIERALLPAATIFYIWMAWFLINSNISRIVRNTLIVFLGLASFIGIYQHLTYRDAPYGPFEQVSSSLRKQIKQNDIILHANKMSLLPVKLFDSTLEQKFIGDQPGSGQDTLARATQQVLGIKAEYDVETAIGEAERIWFIIFERDIPNFESGFNPPFAHEYIQAYYKVQTVEEWNEIRIFLYVKKPR